MKFAINQRCEKILKCGHQCIGYFTLLNIKYQVYVEKNALIFADSVNQTILFFKFFFGEFINYNGDIFLKFLDQTNFLINNIKNKKDKYKNLMHALYEKKLLQKVFNI